MYLKTDDDLLYGHIGMFEDGIVNQLRYIPGY